ncbi:MAG: J domain-containing protein [Fimbriimonadales bacterium]|nr:J domain-containing protein [Fimbriimonadales bacterium]
MSTGRRAYDLLRAYIGHHWERLENIFEADARKELNEYLRGPQIPSEPPPVPDDAKPSADVADDPTKPMDVATAYKVLDLSPDATLSDLKAAYNRLFERSLPTNFPEGSEERRKAAAVHLRVQEAYEVLLPRLDARLKRFRSLDIE